MHHHIPNIQLRFTDLWVCFSAFFFLTHVCISILEQLKSSDVSVVCLYNAGQFIQIAIPVLKVKTTHLARKLMPTVKH